MKNLSKDITTLLLSKLIPLDEKTENGNYVYAATIIIFSSNLTRIFSCNLVKFVSLYLKTAEKVITFAVF